MDNNRLTIRRPLRRRLVGLPKHPRLHAGGFVPGDQSRTEGEEGAHVGHVGVVPHEEAVVVAFAEAGGGVAGVDGYVAEVCGWVGVSAYIFFFFFFFFVGWGGCVVAGGLCGGGPGFFSFFFFFFFFFFFGRVLPPCAWLDGR